MGFKVSSQITREVGNSLKAVSEEFATNFLDGYKTHLKEMTEFHKKECRDLINLSAKFKWKSITAETKSQRDDFIKASETSIRRFKTLLMAERVVLEDKTADLISVGLMKALEVFVGAAKGILVGFVGSGPLAPLAAPQAALDTSKLFPHDEEVT